MKSLVHLVVASVFVLSAPVLAITVFVGNPQDKFERFEVSPSMTLVEFVELVRLRNFNPNTIRFKKRDVQTYDLDVCLADLNVAEGTRFYAERQIDPLVALKEALAKLVYNDDDNAAALSPIMRNFDAEAAMDFLKGAKAKEEDGAKNVLFLAARKGNLKIIQALRAKIGERHFYALVREKTPQNRTVLHAAARAVKNAPEMIRYILQAAPELRHSTNEFGCTPLDAALMYELREPERLAALLGFDSAEDPDFLAQKIGYSESCKPKA